MLVCLLCVIGHLYSLYVLIFLFLSGCILNVSTRSRYCIVAVMRWNWYQLDINILHFVGKKNIAFSFFSHHTAHASNIMLLTTFGVWGAILDIVVRNYSCVLE
jgi:hypothetical protein